MESYGVTGGQLRKGLAWKDSLAVSPEAGGGGRRGESTEDHHRGGTWPQVHVRGHPGSHVDLANSVAEEEDLRQRDQQEDCL